MLILTRGKGDSIQIGDDIKIFIHSIKGSQVKIGVEAPKDVLVLRSELLDGKKKKAD